MKKLDNGLFEGMLEFTKTMVEIITELKLSEKKRVIEATAI